MVAGLSFRPPSDTRADMPALMRSVLMYALGWYLRPLPCECQLLLSTYETALASAVPLRENPRRLS
jgi:hypothetical protein